MAAPKKPAAKKAAAKKPAAKQAAPAKKAVDRPAAKQAAPAKKLAPAIRGGAGIIGPAPGTWMIVGPEPKAIVIGSEPKKIIIGPEITAPAPAKQTKGAKPKKRSTPPSKK